MVATSRHARKKIVDNVVQDCAIIEASGKRPEETGPERTPQMTTTYAGITFDQNTYSTLIKLDEIHAECLKLERQSWDTRDNAKLNQLNSEFIKLNASINYIYWKL